MSTKWMLPAVCAGGALGVLACTAQAEIKIGPAISVGAEATKPGVVTVTVPEKAYADELRLENGDQLHGTLLGIKGGAEGRLIWKHERAAVPVEFTLAGMGAVDLGERAKAGARVHRGSLRLTNGDVLAGDLVSLDDQNLVLDTWYAGKLTVPRPLVRQMEPWTALNATLYSGPAADLAGWNSPDGEINQQWECRDGALTTRQGRGTISREIPNLPDSVQFAFDLAWTRNSTLGFAFFCETGRRGEFVNAGYFMMFSNGMRSVTLMRAQDEGTQQVGEAAMGLSRARPGPGEQKAHVTVLADKKAHKITLQLNGKTVKEWTDDADCKGGGKNMVFSDMRDGMRISNIRVSRWNGRPLRPDDVAKPGQDSLVFTNGDVLSGRLAAVADGKARLETSYAAPMEILLERIQEINLAPEKAGTARRQPGDMRLSLADGVGMLTMAVAELTGGTVQGSSDNFGAVFVPLAALSKLEFKLPAAEKAGDEAKTDKEDMKARLSVEKAD